MKKRLGLRGLVEVSRFTPERQIRDESRARSDVLAHTFKFVRQQKDPPAGQHRGQNRDQGRKDPLAAPRVEVREAESTFRQLAANDRSDQISRNDEEDIDADVAARKKTGRGVESN